MPSPSDFAAAFLLGCIFFGGMACASGLWGLHCRTVRKRFAELEKTVAELAKTVAELENERNLRRLEKGKPTIAPEALESAIKQLHRRLNALTDVVDEIRNGSFTMQWEKKEVQDDR